MQSFQRRQKLAYGNILTIAEVTDLINMILNNKEWNRDRMEKYLGKDTCAHKKSEPIKSNIYLADCNSTNTVTTKYNNGSNELNVFSFLFGFLSATGIILLGAGLKK